MTEQEALATLERLVSSVTNKPASLALGMDLRRDNVLDSVDSLIFFMELENATGVSVPETVDLVTEGYYQVSKLVGLLLAQWAPSRAQ